MSLSKPSSRKNFVKKKKTKSQRKCKRRRNAAGSVDYSVNFSKFNITESNRVLRSDVKQNNQSLTEAISDNQNSSQWDAVSKDHSYSKASKCLMQLTDNEMATSNVAVDLYSSDNNSYDHIQETASNVDTPQPINHISNRRNKKFQIIDFEDLELSNSDIEDHGPKHDDSFNDRLEQTENIPIDQPLENVCVSVEDQLTELVVESATEKLSEDQSPCKLRTDNAKNPKTNDFEKLMQYGDSDLYLTNFTSFFEQPLWMQESALTPESVIETLKSSSEDMAKSPVYLDLDQNGIGEQRLPTLIELEFDENFQEFAAIAEPVTSKSDCYNDMASVDPSNIITIEDSLEELPVRTTSEPMPISVTPWQPSLDDFSPPSSSRSVPYKPNSMSMFIPSNFSTSGGSIERILSPIIYKQPSKLEKYPGISIPFQERNDSVPRTAPELTIESAHQPECRIHLVETPPSFTRNLQSELTEIIPNQQSNERQNFLTRQLTPAETLDQLTHSQLKTPVKPKRTRRTRAQMEIYRQEMARNSSNHNNRRSQHFLGRPSSYHKLHHHTQAILPARFSFYNAPQSTVYQQPGYSRNYLMNHFGEFSNSGGWTQPVNSFTNYSNDVAQSFWSLNPGIKNSNSFASMAANVHMNTSGVNLEEYHASPVASAQNHSSVIWNQQLGSMQLHQTAYGGVQNSFVGNFRLEPAGRRIYTPWHHPVGTSLESVLPSNMANVEAYESNNQMMYYNNELQ